MGNWKDDNFVPVNRDEMKYVGKHNPNQIHRFIRRQRHPYLFLGMTDDLIAMCEPMKADIKARFEEVFDVDQRKNLTIILHPLYKRWTIMERHWYRNQPLWSPVHMFHTGGREGYLPPDLQRDDHMCDHLTGEIGDIRDISYRDLEMIEKCDMWKYGWEAVADYLEEGVRKREREEASWENDLLDDFLDYNFWLAMRDAQDHYSQPWSTRPVELKSDPSRYHIEEKDGYKVRTRIWGEEGDINEMKALVEGNLDDYWDTTSASGRAAARILEIKNENYFKKHGVTLWEAATGVSPSSSPYSAAGDDIEKDSVNREQTVEMAQALKGTPLPSGRVRLEDWLLDTLREKVPALK